MNYGKIHIPDRFRQRWDDYLEVEAALNALGTVAPEDRVPQCLVEFEAAHDYCGPEGLAGLVPNTISGVDINFAAFWHDRLYQAGGSEADRKEADLLFLRLILILMFDSKKGSFKGSFIVAGLKALFYYQAVYRGGKKCFNYHNLED